MFEGEVLWRGEQMPVARARRTGHLGRARRAMNVLANQEQWDQDMRAFARELTERARWRRIRRRGRPEESFAQRIELTNVAVDPGDSFSILR